MFFHSFAIKNTYSHFMQFLLCVYSLSGQQLPSGNQGRKKKKSHCKLDHLFSFKQTHSGFPSVGQMSVFPVVRKSLISCHSPFLLGRTVRGFIFLAALPHAASFLFGVLIIFVLSVSSRKEKWTRSTKVWAVFEFASWYLVPCIICWRSMEITHAEVPQALPIQQVPN